ncbi:MAG: HDOD domain-containing protein [Spirochaetota bacterium]|nr:MAG: HDOD domain-containing protein [Spirochaetota bacterium]
MKLSKIKKTIETVKELPTLPIVANKVNALLYDPKSAAGDLAKIIENDQSLTTKILTLVNSAYYGLSQRVTNITQAIALLGYKNISHMVMTLSVFETLKDSKHGSFNREDFWLHSIGTAIMSVKIAEMCMYSSPEDTFTGGLLHDLGKVFMDGYLHEEFQEIIDTAGNKNISFYEAEHELFDVDHAMIGHWIARAWKLPLHVIATIKHHHQEVEQRTGLSVSSDLFIDIVRVADIGVKLKGYGNSGDGKGFKPTLEENLFKRLPVFEDDIFTIIESLQEEIDKAKILMSFAV